jgi:hypothetical protein
VHDEPPGIVAMSVHDPNCSSIRNPRLNPNPNSNRLS